MTPSLSTVVVSTAVSTFVIVTSAVIGHQFGFDQGRLVERESIMSTAVTIGNPNNPDCSVDVTLGMLKDMAELGVYSWAQACEEDTQ